MSIADSILAEYEHETVFTPQLLERRVALKILPRYVNSQSK